VVSHDRYFLDKVTNRTLDLSFGRLEDYPAAYARYLALREERFERRMQEYQEQQAFITRTEEFIRRYKAGQRSREARGRQTRLERLERIARPELHTALKLSTSTTLRSGREAITMTPLRVGYTDGVRETVLLTTPELRVERGDRVAIIGDNGSGKSTLLKTIVGELPALKGRVGFGTNVKIGYYAQGHESLPPEGTPMSVLLDAQPMGEESARSYLARFLFSGDDVDRSIGLLSGGERSRLALARLLVEGANLLILDEPTNHLDIQSRETLEEMLSAYDGTVVFVSHDRFFVDRVATRVWEVSAGRIQTYLGNYSDAQYQKARAKVPENAAPAKRVEADVAKPVAVAQSREPKRAGAESTTRLQRKLEGIEREIGKLEGKLNELSDAIAIAGLGTNLDALTALSEEYAAAQEALDTAYLQWEEVNATLTEASLVATS
jgi:ATP-binding cassette subfamily F protein 3